MWFQHLSPQHVLLTLVFLLRIAKTMPFRDKVVLITGANSGIGAACAEYFAKEGALLALVGRNANKFDTIISRIKENDIELDPLVILADITSDAERIVVETIEKYGHLDILINSAGVLIPGSLETMIMKDFDAIIATNVRGIVELSQLAMPHLIATKGNIINISSAASIIPASQCLAYACSKAALDHFTKCIAMEFAPKGVRINAINPGFIDTDIHITSGRCTENEYADVCEYQSKKHPIQRIGFTKDCVNAIAFLADDNASFITGIIVPVDGGLSTQGSF